jgi:uncharacterized protein YjbI with pentapeptide repeats
MMKIESEKHRMDVHKADLSGSKFDDVNLSGSDFHNIAGACIANARLDGATIDGIALTDLLAYWRAGHGAKSA